jgi:hypothetical protein
MIGKSVMRDHEWFVLDSLAFDLRPDDAHTCRQSLAARLRYAETSLPVIFKRLNIALGVLGGIVGVMIITSVIALFVSRDDAATIFSGILWPLSLMVALYVASCLYRYLGFEFLVPTVLKHPDLEVFCGHLKRMAKSKSGTSMIV